MANLLVDWTANTEADMSLYRVYRASSSGGTFTLLATVSHPQSSYLDTAPLVPTSAYKVSAVDTTGNESTLTSAVSYTAPPVEPEPEPVPSTVGVRQIKYLGLNSLTGSLNSAILSGSTLQAFIFWRGNVTCTLSDNMGNVWADCGAGRLTRPSDGFMQAFYAKNVLAGAPAITATFSEGGATFMYMIVLEVVGAHAVTPIDDFSSGIMSSGTAMITNTFTPSSSKGMILAFADASTTTTTDQIAGINATNILTVDEVTALVEGITYETSPGSNITARANSTASAVGGILAVCYGASLEAPPPNPVLQSVSPGSASIDIGQTQTFVITLDRPPQAVETALVEYNWSSFELPITMPASVTFSTNTVTGSFMVTALAPDTITISVTYRGITKTTTLTVEAPDVEVPTSPLPINTKGTVATNPLGVWTQYLLN